MHLLRSIGNVLWAYKWWWFVPLVLMGAFFVFLILTSDQTGGAPFIYEFF